MGLGSHDQSVPSFQLTHIIVRFIREATETSVHLRVGVHTGRVISGVVGLRRWKYDIWSEDVELAQHILLAGLPESVHQ